MVTVALITFSRKYTVRIQEQEEHIESIVVKLNNLEKQKSRLQSEVEILIIDLEKVRILWLKAWKWKWYGNTW